ncbi:flagellar protein FlaG [Cytobacillus suaedae]|nr:flagellar protein FlaG [Cytobacillus suaedae]
MLIERVPSNTTMSSYNQDPFRSQSQIRTDVKIAFSDNPNESNQSNESKVELSEEKLKGVVNGLNDFLQPTHTSLKFELHDKLNEYYVTIVDDQTKEVVREIPSKKLLDMYAAMTEFVGFIVDKKI